jgi:hypothetical protein
MATTQPTPQPPNPTTDSEETPPTTNQHTQEPVDPLTSDGEKSTSPDPTDYRVTGTGLHVSIVPSILLKLSSCCIIYHIIQTVLETK